MPEADRRWLVLILVASLPTAVLGLLLRELTESLLERPAGVGLALLATAGLLLVAQRAGRRNRSRDELRWADALLVGTAQGLAVIPGISRSGATVAAALWRDARGDVAVEFSLLLSMPTVAGAALLVALESGGELAGAELAPLAIGFVAALASGLLAVKALQWVVVQRRLLPFAIYCAALGTGAVILG